MAGTILPIYASTAQEELLATQGCSDHAWKVRKAKTGGVQAWPFSSLGPACGLLLLDSLDHWTNAPVSLDLTFLYLEVK